MRFLILGLMAAATALASPPDAHAQRGCKGGAIVTVTGTINSAKQDKRNDGKATWTIVLSRQGGGECIVEELWGKGSLPSGCAQGRFARASGEYDNDFSLAVIPLESVLLVRSISCK